MLYQLGPRVGGFHTLPHLVQVNQILCCINWNPEWADSIISLAEMKRDDYPCAVVGVDIAAGEIPDPSPTALLFIMEKSIKVCRRTRRILRVRRQKQNEDSQMLPSANVEIGHRTGSSEETGTIT